MKQIISHILFLAVLSGWQPAYGQTFKCGTIVTPEVVAREQANASLRAQPLEKIGRTLSVHAWVFLDKDGNPNISDTDIINEVEGLNVLWSEIGITFKVCDIHYIENYQYDIFEDHLEEDEALTYWYQPNVINIYYATEVYRNNAQVGGYASFPGGDDAIFLEKGAGALTHEMGHFFGLYHTFETQFGVEDVPRTNCLTAGDLLCDTEADPDGEETDCELDPPMMGPGGGWYQIPSDNIMSYYSCACRFTPDQYNRMVQEFLNGRSHLW